MEPFSLSPQDFSRRLASGEPLVVIDVREAKERNFCAIALPPTVQNLHLPTSEFLARTEELPSTDQPAPIVIYCHHGVRSRAVAAWLLRGGYRNVFSLDGGIDAWSLDVDADVPRY